jgi:hypothetical protein
LRTFPVNTATPDPTPCSLLLPFVKLWYICSSPSSFVSLTLTITVGWSQFLGFSALSIWYSCLFLTVVTLCRLTTSSALMFMGFSPVT